MSYRFKGGFSDGDGGVLQAALERWPFCSGREISSPFRGFGIRCPDPDDRKDAPPEEHEQMRDDAYAVEQELPDFSAAFPGVTFVFLFADCFASRCMYTGYAARDGDVVLEIDKAPIGRASLQELIGTLGVRLVDGYFEPLVRGFWKTA